MMLPRRFLWLGFVAAASIAAAGAACAGDAKKKLPSGPPPLRPGSFEAVIANNPISAILNGQKLWITPEDPKDWVKATRPTETNFMPVGVTPPNHATKVKTAAELAATKADLDATRDALAGRLPHPAAAATPATAAAPHPPSKKSTSSAAKARPKPPLTAAAAAAPE